MCVHLRSSARTTLLLHANAYWILVYYLFGRVEYVAELELSKRARARSLVAGEVRNLNIWYSLYWVFTVKRVQCTHVLFH